MSEKADRKALNTAMRNVMSMANSANRWAINVGTAQECMGWLIEIRNECDSVGPIVAAYALQEKDEHGR